MNSCFFSGRFTKNPELKHNAEGTAVVNFTIALNERNKKADGTRRPTNYVPCEAWDTGAETIAANFLKGDPITVTGEYKSKEWVDSDGEKRYGHVIRVNSFEFAMSKPTRTESEQES